MDRIIKNDASNLPIVSICCLAYNHELYISQCIDGFIMQKSNFAFEVLIHDDASTDKTADIIREYEKKYPDIIKPIYQIENQYSKDNLVTFKYNFPRAKGKYIAMCEGDDYWTDPYKLQKQVDFLEINKDYAGCFHDTNFLKNNEMTIFRKYTKEEFSIIDTFSEWALFHTASFVFRKECFFIPKWITEVVSVDMVMFSVVASFGKLKRIPQIMNVYRKHERGISSSTMHNQNLHQSRIKLMQLLDEEFDFKYTSKIKTIIDFHESELKEKSSVTIFIEKLRKKIALRTRIRKLLKI